MKKIVKKMIIFILFILFLNVIDLYLNKINDVSDISNQKMIKIYDNENQLIYEEFNSLNSTYIPISEVNEITKMVFIEVEDQRFYLHSGVDIITTFKAFFSNLVNDYTTGGSTITQQYVKNLYLSSEQTYIRKIKEWYYAIRVEQLYTKDEILEGYLNTIYFNNGIYGINDAARYYFNKSVNDLTLKESTALCSIIKSPTKYCLVDNYENNLSRTNSILKALLNRGEISTKDYNEAIDEELVITQTEIKNYSSSVLYFKDYVLSNIPSTNKNIEIYTNFNSELNNYIEELLSSVSCDASIVVTDKNGYLVALFGNSNYYNSSYNIATMSTRMIGSTIKPMLYYKALEFGMSETDTFFSEKKDFIVDNNVISISNFNNSYDNDYITMRYAMATSDNIYALKTHLFIGTDKLPSFLKLFDIEPINDTYTIALGTQDMSLLKLTEIYNTFSNNGYYTNTKAYTSYMISDVLTNNLTLKKQVLNEDLTIRLNSLLLSTFDTSLNQANSVTGSSISSLLNKEVYAKTGLTDYDSYIVGFTNNYTVGIWSGHSDNEFLTSIENKKLPKELFYKIVNFLPE